MRATKPAFETTTSSVPAPVSTVVWPEIVST